MSHQKWKPLSLTCIEYPSDDLFGQILAYISLTPFVIVISFFTISCVNRDLQSIFFFAGQLINELLNYLLKNFLKELRPTNEFRSIPTFQQYGMPSQHTQFQAFFSIYCCLYLLFQAQNRSFMFKNFLIFLNIFILGLVVYSRIYLLFHTWSQCIVGLFVGAFWSVLWFCLVYKIFKPTFFENIVSWPISKFLGLQNYKIEKNKNKKQKNY